MDEKRPAWCGARWMPLWARKIASKRFNASCRLHDLHYASGAVSRREADRRFLEHMLRQSETRADRIRARAYYGAVRAFGWLTY